MLVTSPRRTPRMVIRGHLQHLRADWRDDYDRPDEVPVAQWFDQRLIHAGRMREAERVLEFMRAGGGVLVHR